MIKDQNEYLNHFELYSIFRFGFNEIIVLFEVSPMIEETNDDHWPI